MKLYVCGFIAFLLCISSAFADALFRVENTPLSLPPKMTGQYQAYRISILSDYPGVLAINHSSIQNGIHKGRKFSNQIPSRFLKQGESLFFNALVPAGELPTLKLSIKTTPVGKQDITQAQANDD